MRDESKKMVSISQLTKQSFQLYARSLPVLWPVLLLLLIVSGLDLVCQFSAPVLSFLFFLLTFLLTVTVLIVMNRVIAQHHKPLSCLVQESVVKALKAFLSSLLILLASLCVMIVIGLVSAVLAFLLSFVLSLLFSHGSAAYEVAYAIVMVLFPVLMLVACLYLILPVYLAVPLIISRQSGPFDAIFESYRLAKGKRWYLMGAFVYLSVLAIILYVVSVLPFYFILGGGLALSVAAGKLSLTFSQAISMLWPLLPSLFVTQCIITPLYCGMSLLMTHNFLREKAL